GQIANNRGGVLGGQNLVIANQLNSLLIEKFGQDEMDAVYWSLYNDGTPDDPSVFIMVNARKPGKYASELSCVKYVTVRESSAQPAYTTGEQSTQRVGWYIFGTKGDSDQDAPFTDGLISDAEYVRRMYDPSLMTPVAENRGFKVTANVSNASTGDYFDYTWDNEPGKPWGSSASKDAYIFSDICEGNIPYSLTVVNRRTLCHTTKTANLPVKLGNLSVKGSNGVTYNVVDKDDHLSASAKKFADVEASMSAGCKVTAPEVDPLDATLSCGETNIVGTPVWTQSPAAGTEVANGSQITLTVKFTTESGCDIEKKVDAYYIIKVPDAMSLTDVANAKVCEGETYTAAFTIENGTPGYSFSGLPVGVTPTISDHNVTVNVPAGTYNLTVKDMNECSADVSFKVDEIVVAKPEIVFNPVCDDQTVDLAVKNPDNTKYTYSWSLVEPTTSSNPTVTGLTSASAGNKYVLTASAKELPTSTVACTKQSDPVILTFKAKPVLNWADNNTSGNSVCPKESGAYPLGVVATNTDADVSYVWSVTGVTFDKNNEKDVNVTPSDRCSGNVTYQVLVKNGNGCQTTDSKSFTISAPNLTYTLSDNLKTVQMTSANCNFLVPNFVGNSSYNTATSSCGNTISYTHSVDPETSISSTTSVTITAKDFCHTEGVAQTISLVVPTPLSIEGVSSTPVTCKGDRDGTITIGNIVGGKETYHYYYKKASDDHFTEVSEKTVSNLLAGDYVLRVVDANGCYNNKNVNVSEPSIVTLTATPTNAECYGSKGKITVVANGGNGGSYIYKYGTASDNIDTQFTSDSELPANTYYVQAFDSKNCKSAVENVTITQPAEFNPGSIGSAGQTICYGSTVNAVNSISVATSIPSATISYRWILEQNGVETEIEDATGISYTPNVSAPGSYTYYREAKDDKCKTEWTRSAGSWTLVINQNPVPTLSVPSNVCANADGKYQVSVSVSDQTGAYTYSHAFSNNVTVEGTDTSVVAANKCGGVVSYSVEITNNQTGCKGTDSKSFTITTPTIAFTDEAKIAANTHIKPTSTGNCTFVVPVLDNSNLGVYDNICKVDRSCEFGDVTYSIKENIGGQNIHGKPVQMTIVASDACVSDEITVYIDKPEPLVLSGIPTVTPICSYATTDITLTATGGTAPYTYKLVSPSEMPEGMSLSGNVAENVKPGKYTFSVTDRDGCTSNTSGVSVDINPGFKVNPVLGSTGETICSESTPSEVKVLNAESVGDRPILYQWYINEVVPDNMLDGATLAEFTPRKNTAASGEIQRVYDYIVVVTDQCSGTEIQLKYVLTVNQLPDVSLNATDGCESATFRADVNGKTDGYNFTWSESENGTFVLGTSAKTLSLPTNADQISKTYYVKAENATTKCVSKQPVSASATVYRKPSITIGDVAVVCPKVGDAAGSTVEIPVSSIVGNIENVKDGDANVSYSYNDGKITLAEKISTGKKYTITVNNGSVCESFTKDVDVFVYSAPEFNLMDWNAVCQGTSMDELPEVSVTWNDNVADKDSRSEGWYYGQNPLSANEIANLSAGNYSYTYKAVNGCGLTTAKNITFVVNQNPTISASVVTSHVCGNSGEINVSTSNGTTPYSYTINGSAVNVVNGKISNL
ncbi:MAG: hypothetical protein IJ263_02455, partial [Paludibacteraceae bacterium]|nr:hypothetical protein [Paludibacteraceae bacterium]